MTVRRVMGIETEYGVVTPGNPRANAMLMSSQVVNAYRSLSAQQRPARWDYGDEDPLADARGFRLPRASAHPSLLTDDPTLPAPSGPSGPDPDAGDSTVQSVQAVERPSTPEYDDPSAANVILTNGARLYVDHAHPEYSSPEVMSPRDGVVWDVAGERVVHAAAGELARAGIDVVLYKNNVDGKGASYGTHENYLMDRDVPFVRITDLLTSFLVTRQVFCGSGRVGLGQAGQEAGFQLSQRSDYIEAEVGLETTLRRPIVNTRDEPHADRARWRRLHLIIGDANLVETATFAKLATTSLMLFVLENLDGVPGVARRLEALRLADPVADVVTVSRDLTLAVPLLLRSGARRTALEIQGELLRIVQEVCGALGALDADTVEALARWEDVLTRLGRSTAECVRDVEWVAKLRLLERMREREALAWDHPRLAAFDLQWSDVRPERGVYRRLLAAGAVDRLTDDAAVASAVVQAPHDTRAFFRGGVMEHFADAVSAASWDAVVLDVPGTPALQRVSMPDPHRGTAEHVGPLFLAHRQDVAAFLAALTA